MPSEMPADISGAVSGVIPRAGWGAARAALRAHWPEYLIEMAGLGAFMIAAGLCVMLISAPPVASAVQNPDLRRALIGVAMGLTAIALIYLPCGMRSGANLNPSVTLIFWRFGKVAPSDSAFHIAAQ